MFTGSKVRKSLYKYIIEMFQGNIFNTRKYHMKPAVIFSKYSRITYVVFFDTLLYRLRCYSVNDRLVSFLPYYCEGKCIRLGLT